VPEEQEEPVEPADPELVGFVLLDPLWKDNEEIGYVSSICRMKRTAHQGEGACWPLGYMQQQQQCGVHSYPLACACQLCSLSQLCCGCTLHSFSPCR
jgi:hypothetical protein